MGDRNRGDEFEAGVGVSRRSLLGTEYTTQDSEGTTASEGRLGTIWAEMVVGPRVSLVTKAEWSLRRERALDSWGWVGNQKCPASLRKRIKAQQEGPLHF